MAGSEGGQPPEVARCYPEQYNTLLADKVGRFESRLVTAAAQPLPETEVFTTEPLNFRMRATFAMWREGDEVHYVMYNKRKDDEPSDSEKASDGEVAVPFTQSADGAVQESAPPKKPMRPAGRGPPHEVPTYPMGSLRINELMPLVRAELLGVEELRTKINDVRFLTTQSGDALISITYNRPIDPEVWSSAAEGLIVALGGGVRIVGRSRKVKVVVGGETVSETLNVPHGRGACHYTQAEGAFTQPNAGVCEKMLGWAFDVTRGSDGSDLCELYCGNGCFTIAIAPNFRQVIATELSKASVELAEANIARNALGNVRVARLSAEEFSEAHSGVRRFHRLAEANITLGKGSGLEFSTLLVDPPRAGLDEVCVGLARGFERIVYVSCNPDTLVRDVMALRDTHSVARVAAFDQFPYTDHLECGVVLERR